ncbi:ABC transporter ATP-binding protein [Thermohalobacter berrensis]|uniref:ABC transporter n=1 Tax=Thermohalobacter berrensis TaxID=99594 RepID=A0A419T699_9FIRM|nr:ATP-binding cassette domain-containing protein [Thermohalobacter berrensis]RKD32962.1 ABC transporter [Thermohalobacter berrensis]
MIEVKRLTKRYGSITAVDNLNFKVEKGEILGFLGPNGAGKTTTMKMLTGYMPATEGSVTIDGLDIIDDYKEAKKKIGYLPEHPPLYKNMTVREYLNFVSELKEVEKNKRKETIDSVIEKLWLSDVENRLIKNISKGYKQRVGLAQAIIGDPDLLILDEPTVGLDPKQIIEIRELIKELGKEHTIILSSHILSEISAVCNRIIIINKGRVVAIDTPENLSKKLSQASQIFARIVGEKDKVIEIIKNIPQVENIEVIGEVEKGAIDYNLSSSSKEDIRKKLFFKMAEAGYPILEMQIKELTLEEVFLRLTQGLAEDEKGDKEDE